jgi:hypothetical protein
MTQTRDYSSGLRVHGKKEANDDEHFLTILQRPSTPPSSMAQTASSQSSKHWPKANIFSTSKLAVGNCLDGLHGDDKARPGNADLD